jgi:hypothetical protein
MALRNTPDECDLYNTAILLEDLPADFDATLFDFDFTDMDELLAMDLPNESEAESSPKEVQNFEQMSESKGAKAVASSKKSIHLQYVTQSIQDFLAAKLSADIQRVNKLTGDLHI